MRIILSSIISIVFFSSMLSQSVSYSECRKGQSSLYGIRDMATLEDGSSITISLDHRMDRSVVIIEKLNDSLQVVKKRQFVLRGDFVNFFTEDFKDAKLIVSGAYCYAFLCDRDNKLLKIHAITLYTADLENVVEPQIVATLNKGRLFDTNLMSVFDGYFLFDVNTYSEILITALSTRENIYKKRNNKREHKVNAKHYFLDCELNQEWESTQSFTYQSEFEIIDQIINANNTATLAFRKTNPGKSYEYLFNFQTMSLADGAVISEFALVQPQYKLINELKLFSSRGKTLAAGAYYINDRKTSSGVYVGILSAEFTEIESNSFSDYSKTVLKEGVFNLSSKTEKRVNSGKLNGLSHLLIEHAILWPENEMTIIGRYIDKPSSSHFRHQYFENFDGRSREISNRESLSGGALGLFHLDSNLELKGVEFILREFKLPSAYMYVNLLENNGNLSLVYNRHKDSKDNSRKTVIRSSELEVTSYLFSNSELNGHEKKINSGKTEMSYLFQPRPTSNEFSSILFQFKNEETRCLKLGRID